MITAVVPRPKGVSTTKKFLKGLSTQMLSTFSPVM